MSVRVARPRDALDRWTGPAPLSHLPIKKVDQLISSSLVSEVPPCSARKRDRVVALDRSSGPARTGQRRQTLRTVRKSLTRASCPPRRALEVAATPAAPTTARVWS